MTTQNFVIEGPNNGPYTFANLTQAGSPYYYPSAAGLVMDGFDHLSIQASLTGGAANTVTLTVWSDTGVGTWTWNETMGFYNWNTGLWGAASFVGGPAGTTNCRLMAWNTNARLWRVRIAIVDGGAAANSGIIEIRKIKV